VTLRQRLDKLCDDHKDAVTAQVGVYDEGRRIGTLYPGKWDFHKGDGQMTTEVSINVRGLEDVYVVLTGYDLDTNLANFRVYVNPLILWVWLGTVLLLSGVLICLIPQSVVERLQYKPRTRLGRAADVGLFVTIIAASLIGLGSQAHAQSAGGGGGGGGEATEHVPAGMGMGKAGGGFAAMNRPANDVEAKAMKEVLCPCGCARQSIHDCDCQTAAQLRSKVQGILVGVDLSNDANRKAAYDQVLASFVKDYGQKVLATPKSDMSWLFPSVAAIGALGLLVAAARRWVTRGNKKAMPPVVAGAGALDDEYADKLDDELAETD
ncbi:MAG: cytochrome c-type biogenesis CcmF C-terminal domain-containing protein, partial [Kofleriaceae bacterium]